MYPNADVPFGKVLHNIAARGCLYAIIVSPENLDRRSMTVNILYGQMAEHRNMPAEDALDFIEQDFHALRRARESCDKNLPFHALRTQLVPSQGFTHPDSVQHLLTLLYENRSLTVLQYDCVLQYLQEQREIQYKIELGGAATDFVAPNSGLGRSQSNNSARFGAHDRNIASGSGNSTLNESQPIAVETERSQPSLRNPEAERETELQQKILSILNKPPITGPPSHELASEASAAAATSTSRNDQPASQILNDPKVQKALDALLNF